jgi:hypothetical protein
MSASRQRRRLAFAALLLCAATAGALSPYGIKRIAAPDEVVEFFLTGDLLVAAFADRTIVSYDAATGRVVGQFSLPGTACPGPLRLHLLDGPAPAIIWCGRSGEPDAPERHLVFALPTGARRPFNPPWERHADVLPANADAAGATLVALDGPRLSVVDARDGTERRAWTRRSGRRDHVEPSPDGALAVDYGNGVELVAESADSAAAWRAPCAAEDVWSTRGRLHHTCIIVWHEDTRELAAHDLSDGRLRWRQRVLRYGDLLDVTGDGTRRAVARGRVIELHSDAADAKPVRIAHADLRPPVDARFDGAGRRLATLPRLEYRAGEDAPATEVAARRDRTLRLFDTQTGEPLAEYELRKP